MEIITVLLAGTVGGALVKLLDNVVQWALARKSMTTQQLCGKVATIEKGQRVLLHDRIKYLARCYTEQGEINYDDYVDLVDMHKVYHELGGDNLVRPMEDVAKLKLIYK